MDQVLGVVEEPERPVVRGSEKVTGNGVSVKFSKETQELVDKKGPGHAKE